MSIAKRTRRAELFRKMGLAQGAGRAGTARKTGRGGRSTGALRTDRLKRAAIALACAAGATLIGVGGTFAYLTGSDSSDTAFAINTTLSISVDGLVGPKSGESLAPLSRIEEHPTITNTSDLDVYAIARFKMPLYTGNIAGENGAREKKTDIDLFTYSPDGQWTLIDDGASTITDGYRTYTYGFSSALSPSSTTTPLFDSLTVINLTEGEPLTNVHVEMTGYAIQANAFDSVQDAWNAYAAQNGVVA